MQNTVIARNFGGGQPNLSDIPAKELLTSQPKDECG